MPFPTEGLIGDFTDIIPHEVVKDMLGVTMLIYDYAKKFTMEGGMTIESFVSQRKDEEDNEIAVNYLTVLICFSNLFIAVLSFLTRE